MKKLSTYIDIYNLVHNASKDFDLHCDKPEDLLQRFFFKTNFPVLPSFLFYILDYTEGKYYAIGPDVNTFFGRTTSYLKDGGPLAYFDTWHQNDWRIYNKQIFGDHIKAMKEIDIDNYRNLLIRSNYRVKHKQGHYLTIAQQSSYLDISPQGIPLSAIGIVTDITPYKQDTRMTHNITLFENETQESKVVLNKFYFPDAEYSILSKREIEVIKWICDGLTTKELATKLSISINTVNCHRGNILQKTNCTNFAEVLKFAIANGIL